jgi:O-antigen/teichoic acid export membrane protein
MVSKIVGTISTRIIIAMVTLAIILINGWYLGADRVGTISLIILAITLIQMLNNFVGGGALVYLIPRTDLVTLFIPAYLWSFVTSVAGAFILEFFSLIPEGFFWHVVILSLIISLASVNFMILMGQERIKVYNIISLLQMITLFTVLLFWLFVLEKREVLSYIIGLYASYLFAFIGSLTMILLHVNWGKIKGMPGVMKEIFRYGSVMQTGNILQFFNYRLSYYFIEFFMGRASLGVYSVGVQLSESVWIVSRSIHMVQYARISNEKDLNYAARLTLSLTKVSFLITLICIVLLYILLILFFPLIFTSEFTAVKMIMASLSIGILTFSVSIILSPYFSGIGRPKHNTISAAIGLFFTLISGWILIPRFGFIGAGFSAVISYSVATLYQFVIFGKLSGIRPGDFLLKRSDIDRFCSEVKAYLKGSDDPEKKGKILRDPV